MEKEKIQFQNVNLIFRGFKIPARTCFNNLQEKQT